MSKEGEAPKEERWDPVECLEDVERFRWVAETMGLGYLGADMVQETALALWRAGHLATDRSGRTSTSLGLALKVLHDVCVDTCRRNKSLPLAATDVGGLRLEAEPAPPSDPGSDRERLLRLLPVLEPHLTPRERDFYVHGTQGYATVEALANTLGVKKSWGHDCFSRLIHKLRNLLGEESLHDDGESTE